jgi:hypothetical protein
MRIGKIGNTTYHFNIVGSIILSIVVFFVMSSVRSCHSDDYESDSIVDRLLSRSDY